MKLNIPELTLAKLTQLGMHQSRTQEIQGSNPTEGKLLLNNLVNKMAEGRQYFTEIV